MLLEEDLELLADLLLRKAFLSFAAGGSLAALTLIFETLGVAKGIQSVVCRGHARADAGEHDDFDLVVGDEGVSKNHSELALAERHVLALRGLAALLVQGTHTFLETQ